MSGSLSKVQRAALSSGVSVIANFSDFEWRAENVKIAPWGCAADGLTWRSARRGFRFRGGRAVGRLGGGEVSRLACASGAFRIPATKNSHLQKIKYFDI